MNESHSHSNRFNTFKDTNTANAMLCRVRANELTMQSHCSIYFFLFTMWWNYAMCTCLCVRREIIWSLEASRSQCAFPHLFRAVQWASCALTLFICHRSWRIRTLAWAKWAITLYFRRGRFDSRLCDCGRAASAFDHFTFTVTRAPIWHTLHGRTKTQNRVLSSYALFMFRLNRVQHDMSKNGRFNDVHPTYYIQRNGCIMLFVSTSEHHNSHQQNTPNTNAVQQVQAYALALYEQCKLKIAVLTQKSHTNTHTWCGRDLHKRVALFPQSPQEALPNQLDSVFVSSKSSVLNIFPWQRQLHA